MSRGKASEDMAYVLLDTPLVPRLDLSDCRPTELPVLSKTTPTQPSDPAFQGSGDRTREAGGGGGGSEGLAQKPTILRPMSAGATSDRVPVLPPAPVPAPKAAATRAHAAHGVKVPATEVVRTLVVDMTDLNKITAKHSTPPDTHTHNHQHHGQYDVVDDDSSDEIILEEPVRPTRSAKRVGGVLKGGGDYVSSGEQRPRPRVSFLLDAAPGQSSGEGSGSMQIRVYAKPPQMQVPRPDTSGEGAFSHHEASGQHPQQQNHRLGGRQPSEGAVLPTGLPPKRFRRQGSADRRHCALSYRKQISQMQAEARLHEAYTAASRSSDGNYRLRPKFYEDPSSRTSTSQLPSVTNGSQSARRVSLFSFKRQSSVDSALGSQVTFSRDEHGRRHVLLSQNGSSRHGRGQLRIQDDSGSVESISRDEYSQLHSRHVEPRQVSGSHMGKVGAYMIPDAPPLRIPNGKPPLPRHHVVVSADDLDAKGHPRVTSASSRTGKVREWLSVDSVPSYRHKPRPSTVSSASSSTRSRDIHSAQQRLADSSRVSSASMKAASDPGAELENMDPVTLNLMARRCKGPSRYRYLSKLKSLNLNTPRPLV